MQNILQHIQLLYSVFPPAFYSMKFGPFRISRIEMEVNNDHLVNNYNDITSQ